MSLELNPQTPFEEGVVIPVDKPLGWSSTDVVRKIKVMLRKIGYRKIKIGHAGTLDPLATGLLLVCVGRATKRVDELQAQPKEYLTTIRLGATTPSYDLEHPVDEQYPWEHITPEAVQMALDGMVGEQEQIPPLFSAKRIDGKRAYEHARQGTEVEMRKALITIYDIKLEECDLPHVTIRMECSKGTYVRSIARDLGEKLGSGGHLTALRRTRSGQFNADESLTLEQIEKMLLPDETKS